MVLGGDVVDNALAVFNATHGVSDDSLTALDTPLAANDLIGFFNRWGSYGADGLPNNAADFFLAGSLLWLDI